MFTFSIALERVKNGDKIARHGWNGKNLFIDLQRPDTNSKMTIPYLFITDVSKDVKVPWAPSHSDVLAEDWYVVS